MKIVRNNDYGGYGLSPLAVLEYAKLKGITLFCYKGDRLLATNYRKVPNEEAKSMKQYDVDFLTRGSW